MSGFAEAADDGLSGFGESSDINTNYPLLFADLGTKDAELMGNTIDTSGVACQTDGQCYYKASPGKGPGLKFSDFVGTQIQGDWKVCVADAAGAFVGTYNGATLTLRY